MLNGSDVTFLLSPLRLNTCTNLERKETAFYHHYYFFYPIFSTHFRIICVKTATIKNEALYKRVYRYLGYIVLIIIRILYNLYTIVMCPVIIKLLCE